jgi:hypothetical protein
MKVYWGKNFTDKFGKQIISAELNELEVKDFEDLYKTFFEKPQQGHKYDAYITIAKQVEITKGDPTSTIKYRQKDHFHRNDHSQLTAQFIAYDGDASKDNPESCIPVQEIKTALDNLRYRYILYTTHSHSTTKNRWRVLIPCLLNHKNKLAPTAFKLFQELESLCPNLKWSNESKTFSQPWYVALRDDPKDGLYESYFNDSGRDFTAVDVPISDSSQTSVSTLLSTSESEMLQVLISGSHPLHETMNKYIYGRVKDGMMPGAIKSHLHAFSIAWDLNNERLRSRKNDIDRLVDQFVKKNSEPNESWATEELPADSSLVYTQYPSQGGVMEEIVQSCLNYSVYPSRPLAVLAGHALISLFCGRSHCDENEIGVVFTCLLTGRSTIGKSFAKKYIKFVLNNFDCIKTGGKLIPRHHASEYVGSGYYTSVKNMEAELSRMPSMISFVSESGHMGKSKAGDMPRVAALEFNLATETGPEGSIESGGQNDLVAPMYSPGFTCFKECTPKVQRELDIANSSDETGVEGRRSHAIMDPIRPVRNYNRIKDLPDKIRKLCMKLHTYAKSTERLKLSEPHSSWVIAKSEDPLFMRKKEDEFRTKGDEAHMRGDEFTATYFGRLEAKATAWATRLAIAENSDYPIITNQHYEIALESLMAEHKSLSAQFEDGSLDSSWPQLISRIVKLFKGDMTKNKTLSTRCSYEMLKNYTASWSQIQTCLGGNNNPVLKELKSRDGFPLALEKHLKMEGITRLSDEEARAKYNRTNLYRRED